MQQPPGEQRYHAGSKAAGSLSVGGSRPQDLKLAKNRIRLYLTLARADRAFHQMSTANQPRAKFSRGGQGCKDLLCWAGNSLDCRLT